MPLETYIKKPSTLIHPGIRDREGEGLGPGIWDSCLVTLSLSLAQALWRQCGAKPFQLF